MAVDMECARVHLEEVDGLVVPAAFVEPRPALALARAGLGIHGTTGTCCRCQAPVLPFSGSLAESAWRSVRAFARGVPVLAAAPALSRERPPFAFASWWRSLAGSFAHALEGVHRATVLEPDLGQLLGYVLPVVLLLLLRPSSLLVLS